MKGVTWTMVHDPEGIPTHLRWDPDEWDVLAEKLMDEPVEYYKEAAAILRSLKVVEVRIP